MTPAIGLDARKARDFGIGTYTRELVRAIAKTESSRAYAFTLFIRPGDEELFGELPDHFRAVVEPSAGYSFSELTGFGRRIRRRPLDLFHAMHYVLPLAIGTRAVVTIHDLIHLAYPSALPPLGYAYARVMIARALARSRAVIAVSEATRDALAALSPGRADRIAVVPNGVGRQFRPDVPGTDLSRVTTKLALPAEYALYLGGAKPHKNLPRVLAAFAASDSGSLGLVVAGAMPKGFDGHLPPRARAIGVVEDTDLPALYRGAAFLVYPTLAEGFGLPVLEAQASGIPVLTSDIPVFRELTASSALLVDPRDTGGIARAIGTLSRDAALRQRLAAAGLARAADFSWDTAADRTLAIYRKALAE